ncbi:hypothetical protein, partial [Pseudomonas aeruginosa]
MAKIWWSEGYWEKQWAKGNRLGLGKYGGQGGVLGRNFWVICVSPDGRPAAIETMDLFINHHYVS